MYIKITIPQHFQLKLIPSLWNFLFLKKGDIHYIGGAEILPSSASTPSSSPPLHESPEALHRRHVAVPLFGLRPPSPTNSPSPARPRARFDAHCNRGEPPSRFPLSFPSFPHRSCIPTTAEPPPSPSSPSTQLR